jgi:cytochrome bd-type quinol oxidase subunit 2
LPARPIAVYLMAIAVLNALAWLRLVVPASMSSREPAFLDGTGMITNPVFVQDLAIWLPLMGIAAIWLWRRTPWGYVISGLLLVTYVIEGIGVAADQWFGYMADPASSVVSAAAVPMFLVLAVIGMVPLFFHFRNLDRGGSPQVD